MFHRNGQQSAELRLHPQELGALQITLKLDDQQAQLHIASAHGQVRAAVEAAMPQLRHALAESGINLGQSSVGGESTRNGSSRRNSRLPTARGVPAMLNIMAVTVQPPRASAHRRRCSVWPARSTASIFSPKPPQTPSWHPFARLFRLLHAAIDAIIPLPVILEAASLLAAFARPSHIVTYAPGDLQIAAAMQPHYFG